MLKLAYETGPFVKLEAVPWGDINWNSSPSLQDSPTTGHFIDTLQHWTSTLHQAEDE